MFERFDRAAKYAIVMAQEEARELCSSSIEVEHVLLGLLASPDAGLVEILAAHGLTAEGVRDVLARKRTGEPLGAEDAEALRSIGIDLDAVRESLEATFGENALEQAAVPGGESRWRKYWGPEGAPRGHIPFTKESKKIVELSLREAIARKDDRIEAGHLMLAVLRAPNVVTGRLLGDEAAQRALRDAVSGYLGRAA
ncbi:Clp protease N-terminal domain-containing protein [Nocardia sp. CDC160]|uniref:Clp protease N-terminal domain-containing protein n=1 Tax=Nocardia sp. CDC160 TaxID=3112166 RepID=UPI002DB93508|nr:Clp protease N-terminal domain-containing protein [Nocardia sp. CDC160]MEC3919562.1 Clp protease N-terminal domain-containing protein [Nocardia sp. CDC160]